MERNRQMANTTPRICKDKKEKLSISGQCLFSPHFFYKIVNFTLQPFGKGRHIDFGQMSLETGFNAR